MVYASVMYDVTMGVDIGIRYPAQKDDTSHKLIGRLKSPAYLIASLFLFSCGMQYNNDNELNFLKDLFFDAIISSSFSCSCGLLSVT